ncbi:gliding motility-associated peptidyl-prolyl isomerase GldI [Flavobacterium sp. XS2P12]|uniref:gliding motility-associated peptidyl-prolyl isomerase GldI n=1 Tax=Flavobacterium melibiosi TaxID=3398734 RepID=UPI003A879540
MKNSKLIAIVFFLFALVSSCKQHQDARKPISQASGSFMKKSIERNKKLIAGEEGQIDAVIKRNPKVKFIASSKGYWYSYVVKNELDTLTPKKGDVAFFDYEIKDLKGNIIYSELELRPQVYYVDKQNIMMGLRDGIKLMRKKEKVNFLFTSHMGYGYHGDNKKIGINQPLFCTVTLRDFKSEAAYRKESEIKPTAPTVKQEVATEIKSKDTITQ